MAKKWLTKSISVFLVAVMLMTAAPLSGLVGLELPEVFSTKASALNEGYYTYSVDNDTATITRVDYDVSGDVTIPSTLGGYPVVSIGDSAFGWCSELTSVTIPDSVTSIGERAFPGCSGLTSIIVNPNNPAYSSENGVLFSKDKKEIITYPEGKNETAYVIPNSVTSIGNFAFSGCSGLTSVTIPNSVTSIGDDAFYNCSGLTSVTIPNSVTSIGDYAFGWCDSLISITIPSSVTSIGNSAFSSCSGLTSVTIPNSVTSIGSNAFADCQGLTSITIPNSVTSIGNSAFGGCGGLTRITIPDSVTSIGNSAFSDCSGLTSVTIPDSVTSIGKGAFNACSRLKSITIPDSVTSIGSAAFSGTAYYKKASNWIDGVLYIGNCLIYAKSQVGENLAIRPGTVTVADFAVGYSNSIKNIDIPSSVKHISTTSFYHCSLNSMNVSEDSLDYSSEDGVLFNQDKSTLVCVPRGNARTKYDIPKTVTEIAYGALNECDKLTEVSIPDNVLSIGESAFSGCSKIDEIAVPDGIQKIEKETFSCCLELDNIYIPESVIEIDKQAFFACSSLSDVYFSGTQERWSQIEIRSGNDALLYANIHFSFASDGEIINSIPGDINGDGRVNNKDYTQLARYFDGQNVVVNRPALDVDGNKHIDAFDAERLYEYLADRDVQLFTTPQFVLSFDANGGSVAPQSKALLEGDSLGELPLPTKEYHTFLGWYTEPVNGTEVTAQTKPDTAENLTVYAHWQANNYTLSFNANGGRVSPASKVVTAGTAFGQLPTPSRDYHSFSGWYTEPSGGTRVHSTTVRNEAIDVTLYAHWELNAVSNNWVPENQIPSDAQIVEEKWTYDYTEYTSSGSSSMSGWDHYKTTSTWSDYGSWSGWSRNAVSESDSRKVETKQVTDYKTQYNYSRYTQYSNGTGWSGPWKGNWNYGQVPCEYYSERGWRDDRLPVCGTDGYGSTTFNIYGSRESGTAWYNETTRQVSNGSHTEYRYCDRSLIYTYHFLRTSHRESNSYPGGSGVSNVQRMVKYRAK